MKTAENYHQDKGLLAILEQPWAYDLFSKIISKKSAHIRFINDYIRPFPGCKILEIGCGTATILKYLPNSIGEYVGFDMNEQYIHAAKKLWHNKPNYTFFSQKVKDTTELISKHFDIVLAIGIIHHLNDIEASQLFNIAHSALKPQGSIITYDNVFIENQNWFAKWLTQRDRGNAVRTVHEYLELANKKFMDIDHNIIHDTLKVPYTIFIMRCIKDNNS